MFLGLDSMKLPHIFQNVNSHASFNENVYQLTKKIAIKLK